MADIIEKDLPLNNAPALTDFARMTDAGGTLSQRTTWQKIRDLFEGYFMTKTTDNTITDTWSIINGSQKIYWNFDSPADPYWFIGDTTTGVRIEVHTDAIILKQNAEYIEINTAGELKINTSSVGVFGVAPVTQQSLPAVPTTIEIKTLLQAYGLCS